jgi:DNA-directed RNA polymerase subunit RPC12/RpoP
MRTWTVAQKHERCGACWREILPDQPLQLIELAGVKAKRIRCPKCASGPVDWPQIQEARQAGQTVRDPSDGFTSLGDSAGSMFQAEHLLKE